ncbi:GNAT family N-acetyltransferase [Actinacidiphila yeochonensis]|uniref:GNAT family N-acetyltransferase n=1 Tax=Actinacidiphila yeochonensis TaxID=89050 RepID=UPI000567E374|nr:GNAT family N-acetyltransferase [Actinacidiphila yeochonensis]
MTTEHPAGLAVTTTGERDAELSDRLAKELTAFNSAATGASDRGTISIRVTDATGGLIGGLTAWTWGGLCGVDMLWVREDSRGHGWGSRILEAAEAEAVRRGCDRATVSSTTFQAPAFYQRHGYVETGRTLGIPGGHDYVHMFKRLTDAEGS